jgi:hypothetical protein
VGWPDTTEFTEYLQASGLYGLTPSAREALLDLPGALQAGIEKWNDLTHYWPFLSTGNINETRYFDSPDGSRLDLNSGIVTFTSLASDVVYDQAGNASLSTGVDRINYRDLRLYPHDAAQRVKPWTHIELGFYGGGHYSGMIAVTAEWGYCNDANLPSAARLGVMALAANMLLPQIERLMLNGGLKELQRGDETKKWLTPKELHEGWNTDLAGSLVMGDYVRQRFA